MQQFLLAIGAVPFQHMIASFAPCCSYWPDNFLAEVT